MTNNSEKERLEGSEGVIEGNRLIAEWLGGVVTRHPVAGFNNMGYEFSKIEWWSFESLAYHSEWNWLMPVVKKIQQLSIEDFSKKKPVMNALMDVEIETLWSEVVSFIKYHNQLKNK